MEKLGNIEEHLDFIDGTIDLATKPSTVVGNKSGMIDRMKIELAFYEQTLMSLTGLYWARHDRSCRPPIAA
jgi:hypothetical protein